MDRSLLELYLDRGLSLKEIGDLVGKDPSTVGYWLKRHGLHANGAERFAPKGGLERDALERLVAAGMSLAQIAERLGCSTSTVRHWMTRYELETQRAAARRARREIGRDRPKRVHMSCPRHGEAECVLEGRGSYRCCRCRSEAVALRRRRIKEILVREAGGGCTVCGYRRFVGALHFHHVDPTCKEFGLGHAGATRSLAKAREEARKCVLLCSNCHAEVEAGLVSVVGEEAKLSGLAQAA